MSSSRSTGTTLGQPPKPASCRDVVARFGDLLDGDLERDAYLAVQRHLRQCAPCAAHLAGCQATDHLLRWAFDADGT